MTKSPDSTPDFSNASVEPVRVRYGETDQMGHAYYANYLFWFEQARGRWCRDRGFSYKSLEARGLMLPVVEAHVRYKHEVRYDDVIQVHVAATEIKRSSIKFEYRVLNHEGVLCTEGHTWHVFMGTERKAVSIPPDVRAMLHQAPSPESTAG